MEGRFRTLDATRTPVSRSNGQRSGLEAGGGIPCRPNPAATLLVDSVQQSTRPTVRRNCFDDGAVVRGAPSDRVAVAMVPDVRRCRRADSAPHPVERRRRHTATGRLRVDVFLPDPRQPGNLALHDTVRTTSPAACRGGSR